MRSVSLPLLLASLPLLVVSSVRAQDTRTVTEPKIPPACVTLQADVVANHGVIALADEQKLSTARIQNALNHCAPGQPGSASTASSSSTCVILRPTCRKRV